MRHRTRLGGLLAATTARHAIAVQENEFSATVPARSLVTHVPAGRE